MKKNNFTKVAITVATVVLIATIPVLMSFSKSEKPSTPTNLGLSDEPVGQTWITTEYYDGQTWYVLKATNTTGECFCLSGKIKVVSTGAIVPVVKNIPASANTRNNACRVCSLPQKFEKIESSFGVDDCM